VRARRPRRLPARRRQRRQPANHGLSGAWIAYDALRRLEVDPYRIGLVLSAVGNHEEQYGSAIGPVGAAVILADKADVHRSRVRKGADTTIDIHDRVNDAVTHSFLRVDADAATITLELELDTSARRSSSTSRSSSTG
jgi:uncharacterized protein